MPSQLLNSPQYNYDVNPNQNPDILNALNAVAQVITSVGQAKKRKTESEQYGKLLGQSPYSYLNPQTNIGQAIGKTYAEQDIQRKTDPLFGTGVTANDYYTAVGKLKSGQAVLEKPDASGLKMQEPVGNDPTKAMAFLQSRGIVDPKLIESALLSAGMQAPQAQAPTPTASYTPEVIQRASNVLSQNGYKVTPEAVSMFLQKNPSFITATSQPAPAGQGYMSPQATQNPAFVRGAPTKTMPVATGESTAKLVKFLSRNMPKFSMLANPAMMQGTNIGQALAPVVQDASVGFQQEMNRK